MKKSSNTIAVCEARSLEVGDIIAFQTVGSVAAGVITGIAIYPFQLTKEQRGYMMAKNLTIPENENEPLGGTHYLLIFGTFNGGKALGANQQHIYLEYGKNVAVFPKGD